MKKLSRIYGLVVLSIISLVLVSCKRIIVPSIEPIPETTVEETTTEVYEEVETTTKAEEDRSEITKLIPGVITGISPYRDSDNSSYIEVSFSKGVADKFDVKPYIQIEPNISFNVSKVMNKVLIKGNFNLGETYKVTVLSGIKAPDGSEYNVEKSQDIVFELKKPKLLFTSDGIILPSVNDKKVYIRTLNVTKVKIIVRKVYANNTTQFLQHFVFKGNGVYDGSFSDNEDYEYYDYDDDYYYYNNESFYNVGDEVFNSTYDIENEQDTFVQTAIDLSGYLDANGIYMVSVSFDENGTSYSFRKDEDGDLYWDDYKYIRSNGNIMKTILLTDIGIIADKNDDGYRVNVIDIVKNNFIRGAKVYLMSRNNQILEEKTTDNDGVVNFSNHKNCFYVLVETGKSRSLLVLNGALSTNGFAVDGAHVTNGIRGFLYTERGVYRPGDTIYASLIARNNNDALEDKQPVLITVYDPTGVKVIENDVVNDGKNGFYTYNFKTDLSARTGIWKIEAVIGEQKFRKDISVETVVPNNVKANLITPDSVKYNETLKGMKLSANYLFGEPASGMDYYVGFTIKEEPISFEKYKDYTFKSQSTYGYSDYKRVEGTLDNNGESDINVDFDDVSFGSVNLLVDAYASVRTDAGRYVHSSKYFKLKKYDTYIGIENTVSYRKTGDKLNLNVVCVTDDGENLVPGRTLKYKIYGNDYYWWWDYSNYDKFIRSFKSDKHTSQLAEGSIVTKDTPTLLDVVLPKAEYLYVEIIDPITDQIVGVNLQSSEWVDPSVTKKIETINISADKKKYQVGEFAEFKFKGAKNSKAIITIEKGGKIINQYHRDVNETEVTERLQITKEMAPNVYLYVTLLQDYNTKENDRPLRLYGILPINVEDKDTKILMDIDAPSQIRPNEKFTVKVKNQANSQVDFTIAVVDEGLLDLTSYKTPSPWEYFFQKLAAKLTLFDNFSEIIDRPYGAINQILKVGGDEDALDELARRRRLKDLGLEEADRFTPVSLFKGVLTTNLAGEASVDFEMPNYMGQVRIMVIAANGNSYGSAEKEMIVKAPIILQPSLPRNMKAGDKLSIPVTLFALEEGIGNIETYYTFKGKTQNQNVNLAKGEKKILFFDEEVGNEVGSEKLTIGVKSNVYNYEETVTMAVNSNNAPIEISDNREIRGKEKIEIDQDIKYLKGSVDSIITISNTMPLGLDKRLKYLIQYPYGCVEQTTSSVFPQLFIDKLSTSNRLDKEKIVENVNAGIERLKLFQLSDGSFAYWPGNKTTYEWATNYVGHFLILARKNGYHVPDSMFDKWVKYTKKKIVGKNLKSSFDYSWKSYALYLLALSGNQNVSEMNYMYEKHFNNGMNQTDKMYLAAAYKLSGEEATAKKIVESVNLGNVKEMFDSIFARDRSYYSSTYGSQIRDIAVYLDCYYTIYGKRDESAFKELVSALKSDGWYSTQTTAYSLIALSNVVGGSINETISGVIEVDNETTPYKTNNVFRLRIKEDAKKITITSNTDGMTYVNYYWDGIPVDNQVSNYAEGFTLERHFYDEDGNEINEKTVKSGDVFWLKVVAKPVNRNNETVENIALTQILPTGWEIDNTRLSGEALPKWVSEATKDTKVSYQDIRDDRVMWFFDSRRNQEYNFFIKINAVTKGEFEYPGTTLEAMYDYNYRAFLKGDKVKVE